MSNRFVFFSMILACVLGSGALWLALSSPARGQTGPQSTSGDNGLSSLVRVNEKARAARDTTEGSVRELADEIFNTFGISTGRDGVSNPFEERLIRAQVNFQHGAGKGVSEIDVVRVINGLGKAFGAPGYARTDLGEVRRLRMGVLLYMPHLIYGESKRPMKEVGSSIDPTMSPLEAAYITLLMLKQKQYNEEYQMTPKERADARNKQKGKAKAVITRRRESQLTLAQRTPRKEEMARVIARGFSTKSPTELMELANKSLDALGVDR